jgi:hypothetical protein
MLLLPSAEFAKQVVHHPVVVFLLLHLPEPICVLPIARRANIATDTFEYQTDSKIQKAQPQSNSLFIRQTLRCRRIDVRS